MTYKGVIRVFDIDKRVDIYSVTDIAEVVGTMNLRSVFYAMNMLDGNLLIVEIHQADSMMNVDVVVGKTDPSHTWTCSIRTSRHTSCTTS